MDGAGGSTRKSPTVTPMGYLTAWRGWRDRRQMRREVLTLWALFALGPSSRLSLHYATGLSWRYLADTLKRMETAGFVMSDWEREPVPGDRPKRRHYWITPEGDRYWQGLVAEILADPYGTRTKGRRP